MYVLDLRLPGAKILMPKRFSDDRGFFSETYNRHAALGAGLEMEFVQDNHSMSVEPSTVRGLHYQSPPFAQSKLVRVIAGAIYDVIVDVRRGSPTYGEHIGVELDAKDGKQLFVPQGFLHGFVTRHPRTEVVYKVDAHYSPEHDGSVLWSDPDLDIDWGVQASTALTSAKDAAAQSYKDFETPFIFEH